MYLAATLGALAIGYMLTASMAENMGDNTTLNALVGAAVTVLLVFIPFSPLLGGGVAGYLQGRSTGEGESSLQRGAVVGAISGVVAAVPAALIGALAAGAFVLIPFDVPAPASIIGLLVFAVIAFLSVLYFVGFSVVGGIVGTYVATEIEL